MKNLGLILVLLSTMIYGSEAPFKGRISSQELIVKIIEKAGNGDLAGVQECLVNGVDINTKGEYGYTALMGAVNRYHVEMVKYLVEQGADINIKNDYDMTALNSPYLMDINYHGDQEMWDAMAEFDAINKPKNREILKYLIDNGADTSVKNYSGYPILIWAIQEWEIEIIKALVANKADLEARDKKGNTALIIARNMEIIKILVEGGSEAPFTGADVNALNNDGRNALMEASDHNNLAIVKYLAENGADINVKNVSGETPLMKASLFGYLKMVKYLVEKDADINVRDNKGNTALMFTRSIEITKILIKAGANIHAKNNEGNSVLLNAAKSRDLEKVKYLIKKGADTSVMTIQDWAEAGCLKKVKEHIKDYSNDAIVVSDLLHTASEKGDLEMLKLIIEAPFTGVGLINNRTFSEVLFIASKKGDLEMVKYLVKNGADVNGISGGDTALLKASMVGHFEIIKYLVENGSEAPFVGSEAPFVGSEAPFVGSEAPFTGADLNFVGSFDQTALNFASRNGQLEIVKYLVEKGADVNIKNKSGETAFTKASENRHPHESKHADIMKFLIENGADLNLKDSFDSTALISAANDGDLEMVKFLVENGADLNLVDKYGYTALIWAANTCDREIVKYLVEKGADLNIQDKKGNTALMVALGNNDIEIIKILAENDSEASFTGSEAPSLGTKNNDGDTALIYASWRGQFEEVKILVKNGADINIKNNDGKTALMRASENVYNTEVVEYLESLQ